jgi:DNA-binding protein HU-beta
VNKQELVKAMAEAAGISQASAHKALDAFFHSVKKALKKGQDVRLVGFGSFSRKHVKAKTVRNPRDGSPVKVPSGYRVKFSAGKELKEAANS